MKFSVVAEKWPKILEDHCFYHIHTITKISVHKSNKVLMRTFTLTEEIVKWQMSGNKGTRLQSGLVFGVDVCPKVNKKSSNSFMLLHSCHVQWHLVITCRVHLSTLQMPIHSVANY